jgi:hypothetical protein
MMDNLDELRESAIKLQQGLEFFDEYEPVPSDDTGVFAVPESESLHEFAGDEGVVTVGDLRNLVKLLVFIGVIPDANS